jgi:putative chitinase
MNIDLLKGHVPEKVLIELKEQASKFGLNSDLRLAHFISQASHESVDFKFTEENLNYSEKRMLQIFPKYFNSSNSIYYARKPEKIASKVYASRLGNGNEASKDGWTYRGRGYIQITGKNNYKLFGESIDKNFILYPDLVASKFACTSALWFFDSNNLWDICDKGSSSDVVTLLSKRINGGTIGLKDRLARFTKFANILNIL